MHTQKGADRWQSQSVSPSRQRPIQQPQHISVFQYPERANQNSIPHGYGNEGRHSRQNSFQPDDDSFHRGNFYAHTSSRRSSLAVTPQDSSLGYTPNHPNYTVVKNKHRKKRKPKKKENKTAMKDKEDSDDGEDKELLALIRNPHLEVSKQALISQYLDGIAAAEATPEGLLDPTVTAAPIQDEGPPAIDGTLWGGEGFRPDSLNDIFTTLPSNSNSYMLNQLVISHSADTEDHAVAKSFLTWDNRPTFPKKGFTLNYFRDLMSTKFWERIDWTIRCALLCILPVSIISLHPEVARRFVLPGSVMDSALWVTAPTLGEGMREIYFAIKGFGISIATMALVLQILPQDAEGYMFVLTLFVAVVVTAILAPDVKKTSSFGLAVLMFARLSENVDYQYLNDYWVDTLIGFSLGLPAFFIPFPVQSLTRGQMYCGVLSNNISSAIQGICDSFWTSRMQREFNLVRLRVLHKSIYIAFDNIDKMIGATTYELHTGVTIARLEARRSLLMKLLEVVRAGTVVIDNISKQPWNVETKTCEMMGVRLGGPVRLLATSVDQLLLRIADCNAPVTKRDFLTFERTFADFEEEVRSAQEEIMLLNEGYEPELADLYLGCFLFQIREICVLVGGFQDPTDAPSLFWRIWLRAPYDWIKAMFLSIIYVARSFADQELPRKVKEAIKLAFAMSVSALYQFYSGSIDPITGTAIVPWIYQRTGADSFNYAINRVLGTVIGSVIAFIGAEFAGDRFWLLITSITVCSLAGAFIQTSPIYTILGNAMLWSIISISSTFSTRQAAAKRIQNNVFAVAVYLVVASVVWPVRATSRIFFECESALRAFRESAEELCSGLNDANGKDYVKVVDRSGKLLKEFKGRIDTQIAYLRAASNEPTLAGNPFPTEQWSKMIQSMLNLHATLGTMQFAYFAFRSSASSQAGAGQKSIHDALASEMGECAAAVGQLLYSTVDLHIILLRNSDAVSTSHLVRLRVRLIQALNLMQDCFCESYNDAMFEMINREEGGDGAEQNTSTSSSTSRSASSSSSTYDSGNVSHTQSTLNTLRLNQPNEEVRRKVKGAEEGKPLVGNPATLLAKLVKGANAIMGLEAANTAAGGKDADDVSDIGEDFHGGLVARREHADTKEQLGVGGVDVKDGAVVASGTGIKTAAEMAPPPPLSQPSGPRSTSGQTGPLLTTEDIHSLETFLFGIGALVAEVGELEKAILEMKNAQEIYMKIQ